MNVENLEVGRYSQRNKRTKKKTKKRQNQGQKWRKGEKGEDHPQVEITVGLGCILSKQSIMQNKSKAGQNPRNISQHPNCRNNLHLPRLRRFNLETEFQSFICSDEAVADGRGGRAVWADDEEPRSCAGAAKRRQHVCWLCAECLRVCGRDDWLVRTDVDGRWTC